MQIATKRLEPDIDLLELTGSIVLGRESLKLESTVDELIAQGSRKFILDMAGVPYLDSSGIGMLMSCASKAKQSGGMLRLASLPERVARIMKVTCMNKVLAIDPSVGAAQRALG
jgi:anti-sigma B factor antagonist